MPCGPERTLIGLPLTPLPFMPKRTWKLSASFSTFSVIREESPLGAPPMSEVCANAGAAVKNRMADANEENRFISKPPKRRLQDSHPFFGGVYTLRSRAGTAG